MGTTGPVVRKSVDEWRNESEVMFAQIKFGG